MADDNTGEASDEDSVRKWMCSYMCVGVWWQVAESIFRYNATTGDYLLSLMCADSVANMENNSWGGTKQNIMQYSD